MISILGGLSPYFYSVDGSSEVEIVGNYVYLNNLAKGKHTIEVRGNDTCDITSKFSVITIPNTLTPNWDNKNDRIDLSLLVDKRDSRFFDF